LWEYYRQIAFREDSLTARLEFGVVAVSGYWLNLLLVAALILTNAVFAGSEMAMVSLRDSQVTRLSHGGRRGEVLSRLVRDPNRFLSTIQIGITLAGFLASATAAVSLADPMADWLGFLGQAAGPVAVLSITLLLTYLTLVLGELAPKRLAMQRAEGWSLAVAQPLSWLAKLAGPLVWLLGASTDLIIRVVGGDPRAERSPVTEEEIRDIIATQPDLTPMERRVVSGALEATERSLAQILRPRPDVFFLDAELSAAAGVAGLLQAGHSRAPIARQGDLDQLVGVCHLRDLLTSGGTVEEAGRPAPVFSESLPALEALRRLQAERQQMAVVLDENLVVSGIVTLEDLVEEIVGDIYDEMDVDVSEVQRRADGSFRMSGAFPVHDLPDLGVEVPPGPYTTVAGLVLDSLPNIPEREGVSVESGDWRFVVDQIDGKRIRSVRVERRS